MISSSMLDTSINYFDVELDYLRVLECKENPCLCAEESLVSGDTIAEVAALRAKYYYARV